VKPELKVDVKRTNQVAGYNSLKGQMKAGNPLVFGAASIVIISKMLARELKT
jgi:hypothetical protein